MENYMEGVWAAAQRKIERLERKLTRQGQNEPRIERPEHRPAQRRLKQMQRRVK